MKRTFLTAVLALAVLATPASAANTSIQWGADRTVSPWSVCAYDSTNTCRPVFTLPPSGGGTALLPGMAAINGAIPHVANNAALTAYATTYGTRVHRDGYASAGDGGDADYQYSSSACSLNAGAGDGGSQVQASDGKCWLIKAPSSGVDLRVYGFSSAASDNSAAVLAAAAAASSGIGGGKVLMPATYGKVAQTANLDLSAYPNIAILGNGGGSGLQPTSNLTAPFTLQTNPAYYINLPHNIEIYGVRIVNMNFELPMSTRAAITMGQNFAGTGIVANNDDVNLHQVTINGYNQAFYTYNAQRIKLDDVVGDDTNFVSASLCNDTCQFTRLEAWPFLVNGNIPQNYVITGVANNGGKFQIAYVVGIGTPLVTGDTVILSGVGGTGQPIGRYTITVVDSTHFMLDGSTYAAGYTTGGAVNLPVGVRKGTAYSFVGANSGGEYLSGIWEYDHDVCLGIGAGHGPVDVDYLWCDGENDNGALADNVPNGVNYAGFGGGVFGGAILNKATSVYVNTTDSLHRPFTINGVTQLASSGCLSSNNANSGAAVFIAQGNVLMSNSNLLGQESCSTGYNAFAMANVAGNSLKISNSQIHGAGFYFANPATGCPATFIDGVAGPCAFTPTLYGQSTAGTPAYTTHDGSYYLTSDGQVSLDINLLATLSGAAGNLLVGGIPIAPTIQGGCNFQRFGGINFNVSGYTQMAGALDAGASYMSFTLGANAGTAVGYATASMIVGTVQAQAHCNYH